MNRVLASLGVKIGGIVLALAVIAAASGLRRSLLNGSQNFEGTAQEKRAEEPIPPTPPPTLSAEEIALEQTSQGTRPAAPLLESVFGGVTLVEFRRLL